MRVLLIKTSSMGDVVHTLPALTDAHHAIDGLVVDWVVEEAFAPIAERHPAVQKVIPCALRRWRRHPFQAWRTGEWPAFRKQLRATEYDAVIDAQGLLKSAFLRKRARGPGFGLDRDSAREGLSARGLDHPIAVPRQMHAIQRVRRLFAGALGYAVPETAPDYGLPRHVAEGAGKRLVFIHATTWPTKHWPVDFWQQLTRRACQSGYKVVLPWGSEAEQARAGEIAQVHEAAEVLPRRDLGKLLDLFAGVDGFVAVDTGLAHLAAASGLPGVALYGPTDPALTGVQGGRARSLAVAFPCAPCVQEHCTYRGELGKGVQPPCFSTLGPEEVWRALTEQMQA
jgi:heptosyltransferase-1